MMVMAIVLAVAKQLYIRTFLAENVNVALIGHGLKIAVNRGKAHALPALG